MVADTGRSRGLLPGPLPEDDDLVRSKRNIANVRRMERHQFCKLATKVIVGPNPSVGSYEYESLERVRKGENVWLVLELEDG